MNVQLTESATLPVYFDRMIDAFHRGAMGRHAHLGHWDLPLTEGSLQSTEAETPLEAAQRRLNDQMIRRAELRDGARVLDVACGFGGLIQQIDAHYTDVDLTGVNIDFRQLEICHRLQSTSGNAMRWQEADACDLPFGDATFDTVFCIEAMFHFSSRSEFLTEARRVLKPGGTLVVTDFAMKTAAIEPKFCVEAILVDGYGPWPDVWCRQGTAFDLLQQGDWSNVHRDDATANTSPSYDFIVPVHCREDRDPGDAATRSALMLRWLHRNGALNYVYLSATAGGEA